jgi:hypothetical protein
VNVVVNSESGDDPGTVRLHGSIESTEGTRNIWFDLPDDADPRLTPSGNPWLSLLLPYAMQTGERVDLELPVDPLLLENARQLVDIWHSWYPELKAPEIHAPARRATPTAGRVAQFFSGGVDSWFTLLRHTESTPRFPQVGQVDDLITVWGFDIPIGHADEFRQLSESVREIAERFDKRHVVASTNLRDEMEGAWRAAWGPRWGSLSHVAALASVALFLERRYAQVKIGSTGLGTIPPWGSHPMTDVLFSTSATSFHHDHALYNRAEKMERIAESDYAVSKLKVCFAEGTFRNCSRCSKCHRTLLSFDVLGVLDKATSFDVEVYRENRHRPMLVWSDVDHALAGANRELAVRHGRADVAALIDRSIARSRRVKSITEPLRKLSWRVWNATYRELTNGMVGA